MFHELINNLYLKDVERRKEEKRRGGRDKGVRRAFLSGCTAGLSYQLRQLEVKFPSIPSVAFIEKVSHFNLKHLCHVLITDHRKVVKKKQCL